MSRTRATLFALATGVALAACTQPETILTGERLDLRGQPPEADRADMARPVAFPGQVEVTRWTHRAAGPDHVLPHAALSAAPRLIWSADIGQGEGRQHRITADPVAAEGRIFTVDSRARVMAHGLDGRPLWSRDLTPSSDGADDASGAGLALAGNRLYVSTGFGGLTALDTASGAVVWQQELDAAATGAPTVRDDLVYVVTRDARAWAVETANGRVRWTLDGTPSIAGVVDGAAPAVDDRMVVFPFGSTELVAVLREGGTPLWKGNVAGGRLGPVYARVADISGDPVITGGKLFAGNPSGRIAALDPSTGLVEWQAREGAMSPVLVAGGSVFAVTDQAELLRLDASNGERIWGTELPFYEPARLKRRKAAFAHYGPILAGNRLWVASSDGVLRGFDGQDGRVTARVPLPGGASTNPIVVGQTLYVVSQEGQLLAFR